MGINSLKFKMCGMGSYVLCLIYTASFLIVFSQASHQIWDETSLVGKHFHASNALRTAYHFQPVGNWMNDPNAPMFYKGYYHLFYQYNPFSAVWGLIRWGHAVSRDLVNWEHLQGAALYPDQWYDINGAWSGSATFLQKDGAPVILYTGNNNASQQVTNMAVPRNSSDPLLLEWEKIPENPVMLPLGINSSSFRDPTTAWLGSDNVWRVLVGNKRDKNKVGMALLFKSKDFKRWVKAKHPLHSAKHTGMWECPDFYPVSEEGRDSSFATGSSSVKYVLKNSLDDYKVDYYTVGKYLPKIDRYVPENGSVEGPNGLRYDYGKFYASKTFYDDKTGRRILWGWINESDTVSDDIIKGWASVQAIPRVVRLDSSTKNSLIQWPVTEVEALRGSSVTKENLVLNKGSFLSIDGLTLGAAQVDVEVEFDLGDKVENHLHEMVDGMDGLTVQELCSIEDQDHVGNKGQMAKGLGLMVLASDDLRERTTISFRFFQDKAKPHLKKVALCVDQSRSSMNLCVDTSSYGGFVKVDDHQKSLLLRVLVDNTIVESFAEGGKTCITSRSYPKVAVKENARLFVFNKGESESVVVKNLTAWHMKNAQRKYSSYV